MSFYHVQGSILLLGNEFDAQSLLLQRSLLMELDPPEMHKTNN